MSARQHASSSDASRKIQRRNTGHHPTRGRQRPVDVTSSRSDQFLRRSGRRRRRQRARDLVADRRRDRRRPLRLQRRGHPAWSAQTVRRRRRGPSSQLPRPMPPPPASRPMPLPSGPMVGGMPVVGRPGSVARVARRRRCRPARVRWRCPRPAPHRDIRRAASPSAGPDALPSGPVAGSGYGQVTVDLRHAGPATVGGPWVRLRASGPVQRSPGGPGCDVRLRTPRHRAPSTARELQHRATAAASHGSGSPATAPSQPGRTEPGLNRARAPSTAVGTPATARRRVPDGPADGSSSTASYNSVSQPSSYALYRPADSARAARDAAAGDERADELRAAVRRRRQLRRRHVGRQRYD